MPYGPLRKEATCDQSIYTSYTPLLIDRAHYRVYGDHLADGKPRPPSLFYFPPFVPGAGEKPTTRPTRSTHLGSQSFFLRGRALLRLSLALPLLARAPQLLLAGGDHRLIDPEIAVDPARHPLREVQGPLAQLAQQEELDVTFFHLSML